MYEYFSPHQACQTSQSKVKVKSNLLLRLNKDPIECTSRVGTTVESWIWRSNSNNNAHRCEAVCGGERMHWSANRRLTWNNRNGALLSRLGLSQVWNNSTVFLLTRRFRAQYSIWSRTIDFERRSNRQRTLSDKLFTEVINLYKT